MDLIKSLCVCCRKYTHAHPIHTRGKCGNARLQYDKNTYKNKVYIYAHTQKHIHIYTHTKRTYVVASLHCREEKQEANFFPYLFLTIFQSLWRQGQLCLILHSHSYSPLPPPRSLKCVGSGKVSRFRGERRRGGGRYI